MCSIFSFLFFSVFLFVSSLDLFGQPPAKPLTYLLEAVYMFFLNIIKNFIYNKLIRQVNFYMHIFKLTLPRENTNEYF